MMPSTATRRVLSTPTTKARAMVSVLVNDISDWPMSGTKIQKFRLREINIKAHLTAIDAFISPSHFLKQRYVDWGLPAERIEARSGSEQFGVERLDRALEAHAGEPAQAIADAAVAACRAFAGQNLADDCAIVVIKRLQR